VHRRQIDELLGRTRQEGLTLVPLSIYFKDGRAKVEIAVARGKKQYDKRREIARKTADREMERAVKERLRR